MACCCLLSAVPAMAAEVENTSGSKEILVEPKVYETPNEFKYEGKGVSDQDMTFEITKNNIKSFNYTSGTFGTNRLVISFVNVKTGVKHCNHSIGSSVFNSAIACNLPIGIYEVVIQNPDAAGMFTLVFSTVEVTTN
ncbi:MAG: hypothetical protein IJW20_04670 [Clostridia bacterium]|nr:hypothetical protein [Clostridia bacterium]